MRDTPVLAGALLPEDMDKHPASPKLWLGKLAAFLVREDDRALIGLRSVAKAG